MEASWFDRTRPKSDFGAVSAADFCALDEDSKPLVFFDALRSNDKETVENILSVKKFYLNQNMYGFEGADVYNAIPISTSRRCYTHTGSSKDGFFTPLHVAAEAGHKDLIIYLIRAGADLEVVDYRGYTAEQRCNGEAINGFYESRGLKFESFERYEGPYDDQGSRSGQGELYYKPEGYLSEERLLYRGGFKYDVFDGHGILSWPGLDCSRYIGRFKFGRKYGRGTEFNKAGVIVYQGET